jgi:iron(III) transport system substrate-binding protein
MRSWGKWLIPVLIVAAVWGAYSVLWRGEEEALVVYCAHDSVYSEAVLREFEKASGIPLVIRFDTEATKSLGLVELLIREKENPRCDVFWNNELFGTMDLQARGVLQPYRGPGWKGIPDGLKDPEGHWAGFGARLRVTILNTEQIEASREAVDAALAAEDLSPVAIAKPLYGTTLTHYAVLWDLWGPEKLKAWHSETRARGMRELASNGATKNAVAEGVCAVGYTDTDDAFVALDAGKPVEMLPVRVGGGKTIVIPNTVGIIKDCAHPEWARKLADYLLSPECELALARSASRQVPLGDIDQEKLPDEVRRLKPWTRDAYPLNHLLEVRNKCLSWLKSEYVK